MTEEWTIPDQCEHPDCTNGDALVGVNGHYGCKEHIDWLFETFAASKRDLLAALTGRDIDGSGTS